MLRDSGVLDEAGAASILAAAVSEALLSSDEALSIFDTASGEWICRPWRDVHARAEQIAAQLLADSPTREPHAVGLIGDPTIDQIAAIQGAWLAGAAISILPTPIRGADAERWAEGAYARFVRIGVGTVLGSGDPLDLLAKIDGPLRVARAAEYATGADTAGFEPRQVGGDAPAILQGTAGSTGSPKTAVLSASAAHANITGLIVRLGAHRSRDTVLSWLPLYHDMGLLFAMSGLCTGMATRLAPNTAFAAAPFAWLHWISEFRATITGGPNFAYDILGRYGSRLSDLDLSSVRVAISGGEPIDPAGFDRFLTQTARFGFNPAAAAPAYGMAESTCGVTMPAAGEGARYDEVDVVSGDGAAPVRRRYATLGKPLGGMQVRITAAADAPRIEGRRVGNVEIRGASTMAGYLGHPRRQPGEWLATGDLGYLVDGRLVICGRSKEIVIVAGNNLFPAEIERAAAAVAGVRRGGVVAVCRESGKGRPGLVVVAEYKGDDAETARREITAAVASDCGTAPAEVVLVAPNTVPRTTSGKLRRLETKALLEQGEWA